jgi:hypothetical protein
MEEEGVDESQ